MKPRIVIDARMVGAVPHGFGRYVSLMVAGLRQVERGMTLPYSPVFLTSSQAPMATFTGFETVRVGSGFLSPWELIEIPVLLRKLEARFYHSPTFSALLRVPCPWMVTIHDLNHLQFGGRGKKAYYERVLKPFALKAKVIATVSEFSKKELLQWLGPREIQVIPNALDPCFLEKVDQEEIDPVLKKFNLSRRRYFFCLSNSKPHKNLKTLIAGFEKYRNGHAGAQGWELVLNLSPGEMKGSDSTGVHCLGALPDQEARALMAGAGAVVFPSLYEGFGLPPIEAACLGIPLVVSRIAPHREALADLLQGEVLWVDPMDIEAWAKALARTVAGEVLPSSSESRAQLMRRYSVLNLGIQMDQIYRDSVG
ncbi:glycosyltransferase family 1 protein [Bdellovibrionota bacterium FG-1]